VTLTHVEKVLKEINPGFHIKRYGTSMAAVHLGNNHLFRMPQGEVTLYNVTQERLGHADQHKSPTNPDGAYKYTFKVRRGLGELAHLLKLGGKINSQEESKLRNGKLDVKTAR
jgi:hypothetical protein